MTVGNDGAKLGLRTSAARKTAISATAIAGNDAQTRYDVLASTFDSNPMVYKPAPPPRYLIMPSALSSKTEKIFERNSQWSRAYAQTQSYFTSPFGPTDFMNSIAA